MKDRILGILQQAKQPVSGEAISAQLGVSRVAIWKHIKKMQVAGCQIDCGPKGYRLISSPDAPVPWVFPGRSNRVHHFDSLPSTMDKAMELAKAGCDNFSVVVADHQSQGRGRLSRNWQSDAGGLYFTMVLKPRLDPWVAPVVNLAASLDLAGALNDLYALEARVKWPNDVLVGNGKIAGILSQMEAESDCIHFICLGIGVNVNNHPPEISPPAVSVAQLTGRDGSRAAVLSAFWDKFEKRIQGGHLRGVVDEWKAHTVTLGRQVTIQTMNETYQGQAVDLDSQGGLVLILPNGKQRTVLYGDCFHQA
jgi:BirA family biotin operon repressor/biotin-[acetyl-CoA-carboxylase] ligase